MDIGESMIPQMEDLSMTPEVLRYSNLRKVATPIAERQIVTMLASNGDTFTPNQQIRIPLNAPTDSFVDLKAAYLRYKITNKSNDAVFLDPAAGAHAFIDTFRFVSGTGQLLEEVNHYNALYPLMADLLSEDHRQTTLSMMDRSSQFSLTEAVGDPNGVDGTGVSGGNIHAANAKHNNTDVINWDYRTKLKPSGDDESNVTASIVLVFVVSCPN